MLNSEAVKKHCPFKGMPCSPHLCMMWQDAENVSPPSGQCLLQASARLATIPPMVRFQPQLVHLTEPQKAELERKIKGPLPGTVEPAHEPRRPGMDPNPKYVVEEKRAGTIVWKEKPKNTKKKSTPRKRSGKKKPGTKKKGKK